MTDGQLVSPRFPYLPITVRIRNQTLSFEVLLDTGFDGDVIVPSGSIVDDQSPDGRLGWALADGSRIRAPYYLGTVDVGDMGPVPAVITARVIGCTYADSSAWLPVPRGSNSPALDPSSTSPPDDPTFRPANKASCGTPSPQPFWQRNTAN